MATPAIIDRVAAALGVSSNVARTAINMALPLVLGAFAKKAATPAGATDLFGAISAAGPSMFSSLESSLSGGSKNKFIESGSTMMKSLLGDSAVSGLAGTLTQKAGLSSGAASMLLPIVGQMALGGLAKNAGGLDASGLASLLSSQQSNISAALPEGLGSLAGDAMKTAANAKAAAQSATGGGMGFLKWLVPLVVLAGAAWYFLGNPATETPAPAPATTSAPATNMVVEGVDVGQQITGAMTGLQTALASITDAATAQTALPKLQEAATAVDGVNAMLGKLSAEQKAGLATAITAALPALKEAINKALAIPGVGDIAKPVVDGIIAKLEAMAKPA
jgi:hypothetical protein